MSDTGEPVPEPGELPLSVDPAEVAGPRIDEATGGYRQVSFQRPTGATEIVHIGQTVMGLGGTIDYLVNAVFNFPTLSEAYKVAALDALNKMRAMSRVMATRKAA